MVRLNLPRQRTFEGPAAIWKRVVAFLIDLLVIDFALFWPFEGIVRKAMPMDYSSIKSIQEFFSASSQAAESLTALTVLMGIIMVLYFVLMEYKLGQTIGKMLLNIRIVSESKEGLRIWQCLLRSIIWLPTFPFIVFWIVDPAYALLNQKNQRLLELVSKTRTVERYIGL